MVRKLNKADEYLPPTSEEFYEELLEVYAAFKDTKISMPDGYDSVKVSENAKKGTTAISCCPPILAKEDYEQCLNKIVALLKEHQPDKKAAIEEAAKLLIGKEDILEILAQAEKSVAAATLVTYALRPFLMKYSEEIMKEFPASEWARKGYCPVCGQHPVFSYFSKDENGKRYLICSLCETTWPFARVACHNCLEENTDKLGYFRVDADGEDYKVSFCRSCKSYIKTYDHNNKAYNPGSILKEDIKTNHLDYLAQKEGFIQ